MKSKVQEGSKIAKLFDEWSALVGAQYVGDSALDRAIENCTELERAAIDHLTSAAEAGEMLHAADCCRVLVMVKDAHEPTDPSTEAQLDRAARVALGLPVPYPAICNPSSRDEIAARG
jgi:hypothetical protein